MMTSKKKLKRRAREKVARCGMSYQAALRTLTQSDSEPPTVRGEIARIRGLAVERARAETVLERAAEAKHRGQLRTIATYHEDLRLPEGKEYLKCEKELMDALEALPEDVLRKLQAVMYMGRDADPIGHLLRLLRNKGHWERASMVSGKSPLATYLDDGLELAALCAIDLELPVGDLEQVDLPDDETADRFVPSWRR